MIQSLYTAVSGVINQQRRLDTVANNMSNANTTGFKSSRVDFKDALYSELLRPVQPQDGLNLQRGHGVGIAETMISFTQGNVNITGVPTDFCLERDGFFTVENPNGSLSYTRNGVFSISVEADGNYLVTEDGYYVLDSEGERIQVPSLSSEFVVGQDGSIFIGTVPTGVRMGIATFENPNGLTSIGNSLFAQSESSGEAVEATDFTVRQGAVESSNVDVGLEMTRIIRTQRALQLSSRAITTADDMEAIANNIRN